MNLEERKAFLYELDCRGYTFANTKWLGGCFEDDMLNMAWEMWQASANREGFVLVPKILSDDVNDQLWDFMRDNFSCCDEDGNEYMTCEDFDLNMFYKAMIEVRE